MIPASPILLTGALVCDPATARVEPADLLIADGRIARVGPPGTVMVSDARPHDAGGRLVVPGFVNTHTHGHASLMKGVADRWSLEVSLTNGPWLGGARDPETIYLSALLAATDMLSKGCTSCFDLVYEFPQPTVEGFLAAARGYADAGLQAVLAPMIADRSFYQAIPGLLEALPDDLRAAVDSVALDGAAHERARIIIEAEGLHRVHPGGGRLGLHRQRDARRQPAAGTAHQHVVKAHAPRLRLLGQFEACRALPGDDMRIIEGRHQNRTPLFHEARRDGLARFRRAVIGHHLGAV